MAARRRDPTPTASSDRERPGEDGGWVALSDVCDGDIEIDGNRAGLRQLARILLRCARDTPAARDYRSTGGAAADFRRLLRGQSHLFVEAVNLLDQPRAPEQQAHGFRPWLREKLFLWGCGAVVFILGGIFLLGLSVLTGIIETK